MGKKHSIERRKIKNTILFVSLILFLLGLFLLASPLITVAQNYIQDNGLTTFLPLILQQVASTGEYVVIGWNDLGMHCYNPDFQDLAVLPPFNTLWAQVIKRGDPPQIITSDLTVTYEFPNNTYSVGKTNFWDYDQQLFGVDLPPNIGLTGKGLAGEMDVQGDHFIAEGIPLTEYNDGDHLTRVPYQLANVTVKDASNNVLASNQVVAPVSTEMRCDSCHYDGAFEISTGRVETNILTLHDRDHLEDYPPGHEGSLVGFLGATVPPRLHPQAIERSSRRLPGAGQARVPHLCPACSREPSPRSHARLRPRRSEGE